MQGKMKTNIDRKELVRVLDAGGQMAGRNRTLPVLDSVKMSVRDGMLRVVSFNGETGVSSVCPVLSSDGDMEFCVDGKTMLSAVKLMDSDVVSLLAGDDMKTLTVEHDTGSADYPLLPAADFPAFGKDDQIGEVEMDGDLLARWAGTAEKFVAHDELRPTLGCMYLFSENGKAGFCASDSHRLAFEETDAPEGCPDFSALVHSTALPLVQKACNGAETVSVRICSRSIVFSTERTSVFCRLVEGRFPNFRAILPQETGTGATLGVKPFRGAVDRVLCSAGGKSPCVSLDFSEGMLSVTASDMMTGRSARERVDYSGDAGMAVAVNGTFLAAVLACMAEGSVDISLLGERKPVIMRPEDGRTTFLLMPVVMPS